MTMVAPSGSTLLEPIGQVLTGDEFDALPENSRRELVDGVIHMMASPKAWHQEIKSSIYGELKRLRPRNVRVIEELEVRLSEDLRRIPDVLVIDAADFDWQASRVPPAQVILAIEVVSPGSESDDRLLKPHQYAVAGIAHYWRVEIDPELAVHSFRLGDNAAYVPTGIFTAGDVINAPGLGWAQIAMDDLASQA